MATTSTSTHAAQVAGASNLGARAVGRDIGAHIFRTEVIHTVVGTEATGDVLNIVNLPRGARVQPEQSFVLTGGNGSTITANIGTVAVPTAYASAMALGGSGGSVAFAGGSERVEPVALVADTTCIATLSTVTTPTAGSKIRFAIAYTVLL